MSDTNPKHPATLLAQRIAGIPVAMLTTIGEDGRMHSRPMATRSAEGGDGLWFFAAQHSPLANNIAQHPAVNVNYVDIAAQRYVSVVGRARMLHDSDRAAELWSADMEVWFPKGINDPDLDLIHVEVEEADYWDGSAGTFVRLAGFLRALLAEPPPPSMGRGHLDISHGAHS